MFEHSSVMLDHWPALASVPAALSAQQQAQRPEQPPVVAVPRMRRGCSSRWSRGRVQRRAGSRRCQPSLTCFMQAACSSWKFTSVAAACEGKDVSASLSVRALWVGSGLLGVGCSGFRASCDICTMDECACEEHAVSDAPEGKDVWTCVRMRDRTLCCLAGPRSEHAF